MGANNIYFPSTTRVSTFIGENFLLIDDKQTGQPVKIDLESFFTRADALGLLVPSAPTLAVVLDSGNITGGFDIDITQGDSIKYLYGDYNLELSTAVLTDNRTQTYQDTSGIVALTKDLPTTLYSGDGTLAATRTVNGDSAAASMHFTELDQFTVEFDDVITFYGTGGTTYLELSSALLDISSGIIQISKAATTQQELRFVDGGGTTGTGVLTNADLTAARTWTLPDVTGEVVLDTTERIDYVIACSDETTALTTGTAKATFRMPYGMTITEVRASLTGAGSTSGVTTIDINEGGTSILSTKLTIDYSETTSTTAAVPAVISDSALADDAEITIDIDGVTGGADETGLKIYLIGTYA